MNDEVPWWVYPISILVTILALRGGILIGEHESERTFQEQAVKAGVAHWTNGVNGDPVFKFKEIKQ